jgi:hypothetical protein
VSGAVYAITGSGSAKQIGSGATSGILTAGQYGSLVGWVDTSDRKHPQEFVFYDVAARRELIRTAVGNDPTGKDGPTADGPLQVAAIDGGTAYLAASDGLRKLTIATGENELIKPGAKTSFLQAAANGRLVWEHPAGEGTFFAAGFRGDETAPVDLVSCSVASRSCSEVVEKIAASSRPPLSFRVPVGDPVQ